DAPSTTAFYTLSLHDALPISHRRSPSGSSASTHAGRFRITPPGDKSACQPDGEFLEGLLLLLGFGVDLAREPVKLEEGRLEGGRSEEHTSELQSRENLVCRLL